MLTRRTWAASVTLNSGTVTGFGAGIAIKRIRLAPQGLVVRSPPVTRITELALPGASGLSFYAGFSMHMFKV